MIASKSSERDAGEKPGATFPHPALAAQTEDRTRLLLLADRVFDGKDLRIDAAVLFAGREIIAVGSPDALRGQADREIDLGDATILPGFIELHAHIAFRKVPRDIVLRHGTTTVRDLGGPLLPPSGGVSELRLLTARPILTPQGGYPLSVFGKGYIAEPVTSAEEARQLVGKLVEGGAVVIKIAERTVAGLMSALEAAPTSSSPPNAKTTSSPADMIQLDRNLL